MFVYLCKFCLHHKASTIFGFRLDPYAILCVRLLFAALAFYKENDLVVFGSEGQICNRLNPLWPSGYNRSSHCARKITYFGLLEYFEYFEDCFTKKHGSWSFLVPSKGPEDNEKVEISMIIEDILFYITYSL